MRARWRGIALYRGCAPRFQSVLSTAVAVVHQSILMKDPWSGVAMTQNEIADETVRATCAYLGVG